LFYSKKLTLPTDIGVCTYNKHHTLIYQKQDKIP